MQMRDLTAWWTLIHFFLNDVRLFNIKGYMHTSRMKFTYNGDDWNNEYIALILRLNKK